MFLYSCLWRTQNQPTGLLHVPPDTPRGPQLGVLPSPSSPKRPWSLGAAMGAAGRPQLLVPRELPKDPRSGRTCTIGTPPSPPRGPLTSVLLSRSHRRYELARQPWRADSSNRSRACCFRSASWSKPKHGALSSHPFCGVTLLATSQVALT